MDTSFAQNAYAGALSQGKPAQAEDVGEPMMEEELSEMEEDTLRVLFLLFTLSNQTYVLRALLQGLSRVWAAWIRRW